MEQHGWGESLPALIQAPWTPEKGTGHVTGVRQRSPSELSDPRQILPQKEVLWFTLHSSYLDRRLDNCEAGRAGREGPVLNEVVAQPLCASVSPESTWCCYHYLCQRVP